MATIRCETHRPNSAARAYVATVKPVGPVRCGAGACPNPGLVWLEAREKADYDRGERAFKAKGSMRVRVE